MYMCTENTLTCCIIDSLAISSREMSTGLCGPTVHVHVQCSWQGEKGLRYMYMYMHNLYRICTVYSVGCTMYMYVTHGCLSRLDDPHCCTTATVVMCFTRQLINNTASPRISRRQQPSTRERERERERKNKSRTMFRIKERDTMQQYQLMQH